MPGRDDHFVAGSAEAGGLDKVCPQVAAPKGLVISKEGVRRSTLLSAHGESQQRIVVIEEDGDFRFGQMILDDVPVRLNQTVIFGCLEYTLRGRPIPRHQSKT